MLERIKDLPNAIGERLEQGFDWMTYHWWRVGTLYLFVIVWDIIDYFTHPSVAKLFWLIFAIAVGSAITGWAWRDGKRRDARLAAYLGKIDITDDADYIGPDSPDYPKRPVR